MKNLLVLIIFIMGLTCKIGAQTQDSLIYKQIIDLSLEELMNIDVTTVTKSPVKLDEVASAITVIRKEEILRYGWLTIADILKTQPGIFIFSDRIYNFISTRGFYQSNDPNSRILLLLDGKRVAESFGYYNGHLPTIDLKYVDRIEIVRGPNSVSYGTNAMFMVINVISKRAEDLDGLHLFGEVGTFNHNKVSAGFGKKVADDFDIIFQGTYSTGKKETIYFSEYDNNDYNSGGFSKEDANREILKNSFLKVSYKNIELKAFYNDRKKYIPTGLYGGVFNDDQTFFNDVNLFAELTYSSKIFNDINIDTRLFSNHYHFIGEYFYYPDEDNKIGPSYESEYNNIENSSIGTEILLNKKWNDTHKTVLGLEAKLITSVEFNYHSVDDNKLMLNEYYYLEPNEEIFSLYLSHSLNFTKDIILEAGFHYDNYESFGDHLSIRSSISYNFTENGWIKLLFGEAFRAPNYWELNGGFLLNGNKNLKPEIVRNIEAICEYYINKNISLKSSFYYYNLTDNIRVKDGISFTNNKGTYAKGVETELKFLINDINGYVNFSYSTVNNEVDDSRIPFTPEWMLKAGFTKPLFTDEVSISLETQVIGPRLKPLTSQPELKTYFITNFSISNIQLADYLIFTVQVNNLFDKKYEHPAFLSDLGLSNMNSKHPVYDIPAERRSIILKSIFNF